MFFHGKTVPVPEGYFYYLATPYSKYHAGIDQAWKEACALTAWLMKRGHKVFCPIAFSHAVAAHGEIDPYDADFWLNQDFPYMQICDALLIAELPGWNTSHGVGEEIKEFEKMGKPIFKWRMDNFKVRDEQS